MIRPETIKPCFDCKLCDLRKFATRPVWGRGPKKPLFVLIGEGPGAEEDKHGIPFHPEAPAGRLITDILDEIGVKRSEIYITNATRCFKGTQGQGGGTISVDHIKACKPYLQDELKQLDCEYIVLAGNEALKSVLGHQGITKEHGRLRLGPNGFKYFPILHPASALPFRNPENRDKIKDALRELVAKIRLVESDPLAKFDCHIITTGKMLDEFEREMDYLIEHPDDKIVFHDYETNSKRSPFIVGPDKFIISGCAFSWERNVGWYLPLNHQNPADVFTGRNYERCNDIMRRFAKSKIRKGNQNLKYEYLVTYGMFGIKTRRLYTDPMLLSHLLAPNPGTHGLDVLAWQVGMGGYDLALEQWFIDNKIPEDKRDYTRVPLDILGRYAIGDVICSRKYHYKFIKEVERRGQKKFYINWVMSAVSAYADMEAYGMLYDSDYMNQLDKYYSTRHHEMRVKLRKLARAAGRPLEKDFNFDSHEDMARLLHEWLKLESLRIHQIKKHEKDRKLPWYKRSRNRNVVSKDPADYVEFNSAKKGKAWVSTSKNSLSGLLAYYPMTDIQREFIILFRDYRSGRTRYVRNVKGIKEYVCADKRLRSSLLQHGTATSRRSSKDPNLQNIPRDAIVKRGMVAPEDFLFVINDYKNLEVRIAAAKSGDKALLAAFNSGKDVHSYLGSKAYNVKYERMVGVLGMKWDDVKDDEKLLAAHKRYSTYRARAKVIWWVLLFGGGPDKIAQSSGIPFSEAVRLQEVVYQEFPGLKGMFEDFAWFAHKHGYAKTDFGRRRYLDGIRSTDARTYSEARRQSLNTPIQGTAADITLRAVVLLRRAWRREKLRVYNVQEVHDAVTKEAYYKHVYKTIMISREIMESITCPASKGKIKFEVDTNVGAHLGSKIKVDSKILQMAKDDPRELYELCRKDLEHPPEYYA